MRDRHLLYQSYSLVACLKLTRDSQVDLIIPEEVCDLVQQKLLAAKEAPAYQRVIMKLGDILSGDFFTEYIKLRTVVLDCHLDFNLL